MLELTFITSNNEKLAHARHICKDYPVRISKQKNYGIGYIEPRIDDRDELLRQSIEDAKERFRKTQPANSDKLFFIEDTSVKIHALSSNDKEVPGVDIKYWMQENDFDTLDLLLKEQGNDRRTTVRSDIVLVLNKTLQKKYGSDYLIFTSSVEGTIIDKEHKIKPQPIYPWLNDRTFNKWFIPNGAEKPLSALPINKADQYDFRRQAYKDMLDFLSGNNLITKPVSYKQLDLFPPHIFLVCGPTCAGKTTLSTYMLEHYNYYHLEASDFMHLSYYERHGIGSKVKIGDFAEKALKEKPTIVVDQITEHLDQIKKNIPIVITGFRSPEEVEAFRRWFDNDQYLDLIYIDAKIHERYERNLIRERADDTSTFEKFEEKNQQQDSMGLLKIKEQVPDENIILNEEDISSFYEAFERQFYDKLTHSKHFSLNKETLPTAFKRKKLQNTIVEALYPYKDDSNGHTTAEIARLTLENAELESKNKNNVSRYFNQYYYPFYDISVNEDGKNKYQLSHTGISYYNWLKKHLS
ncbi:non-canonical purine NTP pyrophosphatase [Sphingobacterium haloxyli]|uniref:Uncharacterized protein n=1 Tax=Sphingobacterium haloxyli TaxID=2100533 RepID=A0A2S9J5F6_9SPHI|nr:non-canonical purine NTP pyrophosphatase [Sphingobacterium haloxyli]PRD48026.1 hypothetical protein C5745_05805 [Sphingobacterium haloxyli]